MKQFNIKLPHLRHPEPQYVGEESQVIIANRDKYIYLPILEHFREGCGGVGYMIVKLNGQHIENDEHNYIKKNTPYMPVLDDFHQFSNMTCVSVYDINEEEDIAVLTHDVIYTYPKNSEYESHASHHRW